MWKINNRKNRKTTQKIASLFNKGEKPGYPAPEARPLSPCYIEPYITVNGVQEENKGYIPVALLMGALDNDDMLNIAVAGNYGVGKSSVIKTAEKDLGKAHSFISISLAALLVSENKAAKEKLEIMEGENRGEKEKESEKNPDDKEQEGHRVSKTIAESVGDKQIEYSILQQILYHERPQRTPKSRINRIHRTDKIKPLWVALYLLFFIIALTLCLAPEWVSKHVLGDSINANQALWMTRWTLFALGGLIIWGSYYIGTHFNLSITRIGYKNVEMKIKEDMSVFNAYLDEIVYFFESTKYDVVVFEDLDRFENREVIFYKLRELNTILNNSDYLPRKINFVYAVLDDLFQATERVKFFDYIVTVIPVVSSLNSYEKLKESIHPESLFEKLGQNELRNLCDYFQDMRLLINIVNEFNQFVPLLDPDVMTEKVLFGLIVYKNYVPSDFALMYNKSGVVASIIEHADEYRDKTIAAKNARINLLKQEILSCKTECEERVVKLRKSYLEKGKSISGYAGISLVYKIDGNSYDSDTVAKDARLFDLVRKGNSVFVSGGYPSIPVPQFSAIERNMGGVGAYEKKESEYENDADNRIQEIEAEIQSLERDISSFLTTIQSIYSVDPSSLDKELNKLTDQNGRDLVKFLVLNGYMDRHYQYYVSYFYPNALKREDRNFVMRAARHEGIQYEVRLENVGEVIKRFSRDDFASNTSLLNVDLVNELYHEIKYKEFRGPVCRCILMSRNLDFILACYRSERKMHESFFYQILGVYDFWDEIQNRAEKDQDALKELYLRFCPLEGGRVNRSLKAWLSDNYSFIDKRMESISIKRVVEDLMGKCAPVFRKLSLHNTPDEVLRDILENRRYTFTRFNVNVLVRRLGFYDKYASAAYTALREEKSATALRKRVETNWETALKKVFPDTSIHETESALVEIINDRNCPISVARSYLSKQAARIKFASSIDDHALKNAFKYSLVEATWPNMFYYTKKIEKSVPLEFLHNNIFKDRVLDSLSENDELALRDMIVFSDQLDMTKYAGVVSLFNVPFNRILRNVHPGRMKILIENDYLVFNVENFKVIKENYSFSGLFLSRNIKSFLRSPGEFELDNADMIAAMESLDTKASKSEFVRATKSCDFAPDAKLAALVRPLFACGELKASEINPRLLHQIVAKASDKERVSLGRRALISLPYSAELATSLLNAMGDEYKRLTTNTTKSTITYSRDAIMVVNHLAENGYLHTCEKKDGKIIVIK